MPSLGYVPALYMCLPTAAPRAAELDSYLDESIQQHHASAQRWARRRGLRSHASRGICLFQLGILASASRHPTAAAGAAAAGNPSLIAAPGPAEVQLDAVQWTLRVVQAAVELTFLRREAGWWM